MYTKSLLAAELRDKEYRGAFVASQIRIGLPMQCRALRESRGLTQPQLAEVAGMTQPRISEIERPGERRPNMETLLRLAAAYDVALQVRFVPFSRLVDDDDNLDLKHFNVASFEQDLANLERLEEQMESVVEIGGAHRAAGDTSTGDKAVSASDEGAKIAEENNGNVSSIAGQVDRSTRRANVKSSRLSLSNGPDLRAS